MNPRTAIFPDVYKYYRKDGAIFLGNYRGCDLYCFVNCIKQKRIGVQAENNLRFTVHVLANENAAKASNNPWLIEGYFRAKELGFIQ